MPSRIPALLILCATLVAAPALAQKQNPTFLDLTNVMADGVSKPRPAEEGTLLGESPAMDEILSNPAVLTIVNRVILEAVIRDSGWAFVRDIELELKTFHQDGNNPETFFGLAYAYEKQIAEHELDVGDFSDYGELNLSFTTEGNVSFDRDKNVEDFLQSQAQAGFYTSWGGVTELSDEDKETYNGLLLDLAQMNQFELDTSPKKEEFLVLGRGALTNQYGFDVNALLGFETDQSWDTKQFVYGGEVSFVLSPWERFGARGWDEISTFAKANVLDYPFALIRWISGMDPGFSPRSMSVPALVAGLGWVDPQSDDPRAAAGDKKDFLRFHTMASFRTPILDLSETTLFSPLATLYADANVRYFREIDAKDSVDRAGLDEYVYFTASISSTSGVFVSYSRGQLPFDSKTDNVYQAGYRFHF